MAFNHVPQEKEWAAKVRVTQAALSRRE